jgi:hypothetical protein
LSREGEVSGARARRWPEIEVGQRLLLVALGLVLLAQADDLAEDLDVEAFALGLVEDALHVGGDRGLVLLQALDALDEALQPALGGGGRGRRLGGCRIRRPSGSLRYAKAADPSGRVGRLNGRAAELWT